MSYSPMSSLPRLQPAPGQVWSMTNDYGARSRFLIERIEDVEGRSIAHYVIERTGRRSSVRVANLLTGKRGAQLHEDPNYTAPPVEVPPPPDTKPELPQSRRETLHRVRGTKLRGLNAREMAVQRMLAQGDRVPAIARALSLSPAQVRIAIEHIKDAEAFAELMRLQAADAE